VRRVLLTPVSVLASWLTLFLVPVTLNLVLANTLSIVAQLLPVQLLLDANHHSTIGGDELYCAEAQQPPSKRLAE